LKCAAASAALAAGGIGTYPGIFNSREKFAQYHADVKKWEQSSWNETDYVECFSDDGKDGLVAGDGKPYIQNGDKNALWSAQSKGLWPNFSRDYRFFTANYLNYLEWVAANPPPKLTRLQIVRDVALNLASSLQNVNLGLMRYSTDAQGGYVLSPIKNIDDNRTDIIDKLNSFDPKDGSGGTPLSETLYEAALYLTGGTVDYGAKSQPGKSTTTSAVLDGKYVSPIQYSCQKNYVVYLTDGAPTVDDDANTKIGDMIGGTCKADSAPPAHDSGWTTYSGVCMDDLAGWMANENTDLGKAAGAIGKQQALTYMIGFGDGVKESVPYLNMIAKAGGTNNAFTAADVGTLTNALQQIFSSIQEDSSTFVTPSISVNAFNRAQTDQDLYFSLFRASNKPHWPGNLKKYKLSKKNEIVDANGTPAVGVDGFFSDNAQSFWSPSKDGADVTAGGAASQQGAPADRKLFTVLDASKTWTDAQNQIDTSNTSLTDFVVGTGMDNTACSDACKKAISWIRGVDVNDDNKDNIFDDQHKFMGDPLHGRPAIVPYGKLAGDITDVTVFVPTNDGLLHAISGPDNGGKELWAFMPPELLGRIGAISQTGAVTQRSYGLDGDVRVLRMDKNQNGTVDSGDRVWLFFGMRMGGNHYYGLDVTDRTNPKLMWNIGPDTLPQLGQTWSAPVVARVNVSGGNDDTEKFVLIFGGGYDTTQETQGYSPDIVGNRVFMVDAKTGKRLWFAGGTANSGGGTQPDLKLDDPDTSGTSTVKTMNNSIPSRVTVIDTDGDLFADRMYVGDMGGRVWRFDIFNGQTKDKLVTGGVIAALGQGGADTASKADNRRFYNAPDVALMQIRGQDPFYNVAIGSGYRGHPLDTQTQERFYSIRDKMPYAKLTQDLYDKNTPLTNDQLVDITPSTASIDKTANGWRLDMTANGGKWVGEKVLSESVTVNNVILFTSFEPSILGSQKGACFPATTNRAYAVSAFTGRAALDFNDDKVVDDKDRSTELNQEGIVGEIQVALKAPPPPGEDPTVCLAGMQVLKKCVKAGGKVRTFWNRSDAR
jgi:type IV pilus assembly protein PilY1